MSEKLKQLLELCRPSTDGSLFIDVEAQGIRGDRIDALYHFYLGRRTTTNVRERPDFGLDFADYPGGYLTRDDPTAGDRNYQMVVDTLRASQVIVVAIDAPYLMEPFLFPTSGNGEFHDRRNVPAQIADVVADAFQSDTEPRLFILAPIRCEKYRQSPEYRASMVDAVRHGYTDLLDFLASPERASRYRVVTTPVETTGCLRFSHWKPSDGTPAGVEPVFVHKDDSPQFAPELSEQPLCHALAFALQLARQGRRAPGRLGIWIEMLAAMLGFPPAFADAIDKVARESIVDESQGMAVLQPGSAVD